MHDSIIDYLVAVGLLFRQKGQIAENLQEGGLNDIFDEAVKAGLFTTEQETIRSLSEIAITNDMLEGW